MTTIKQARLRPGFHYILGILVNATGEYHQNFINMRFHLEPFRMTSLGRAAGIFLLGLDHQLWCFRRSFNCKNFQRADDQRIYFWGSTRPDSGHYDLVFND